MTALKLRLQPTLAALGLLCLLAGGLLLVSQPSAAAQDNPTFHPTFPLLDADGQNVLVSGAPVSTMQTCGACHDTAFIASHSGHADAGLTKTVPAGSIPGGRAWETSTGPFGKWDPISYRYLSVEGDTRIDLTTADWIRTYGALHVGGGPAEYSRSGVKLTDLPANADPLDTSIVDPATGKLIPWDWQQSGVVEMNCFLCHAAAPDNAARIAALEAGSFGWANSATLQSAGIISQADGQWVWNPNAFNADGTVREDLILVGDPTDQNCGQCHGTVHSDARDPLVLQPGDSTQRVTLTTGQVFSPQRLVSSGVNLSNKNALGRSWDIHAERVVGCTDCHYAINNPVFDTEAAITRPDHLLFDPRRMDFGEYLYRPLHQFANTGAETGTQFGGAERTCSNCHDAVSTHTWLPYAERHISALACETCHIPSLYAPALEMVDWTALRVDGTPLTQMRGVKSENSETIITGFEPVLLPQQVGDGRAKLTPFNLVTAWYWVYGDPARPVALRDLQAAWLTNGAYAPEILAAFDTDRNGTLDDLELRLDTDSKVALIAARLESLGLSSPRIVSETQTYEIHHNVTQGQWATSDCHACHGENSRLNAAFTLASYTPGGIQPTVLSSEAAPSGSISSGSDGILRYQPASSAPPASLYVLGHDSVALIDLFGMLMFIGVCVVAVIHGGLRYLAARRFVGHQPAAVRKVYMYSIYERQWHWLQTVAIFGLLFTGLVIHRPTLFSMFDFRFVVLVHNALAVLLVINAALSAFYHFVSGEIRQFLPRPYGFFDQAFAQAKYYLSGIFKGEPHPIEKTPDRKMNPLQQVTYLMILNVLLPLQILTGAMMWGAQHFPQITEQLGGLPFLAPFHTLIAWLFATFIVMHVYLTTTGHTPLASIKAMMLGWDEVEQSSESEHRPAHSGETSTL
jgi:thiosulfate reductase cytochrome b subunit